ncbi:MAG: hypothetical protein ACYCOU_08020 [Sulfobacillus sp.]
MMRQQFLIAVGMALGMLGLAGCGANHLATPPSLQSHSSVSQSIETHSLSGRTTVQPFAGTAYFVPHLSTPLPAPYQKAQILYGWVGHLHGKPFTLAMWNAGLAQGFTLFYDHKAISKTPGVTDIFCFTGNWFLWQDGAMAEGGAMNMVTGQVLNPNFSAQQGHKWKQLCPVSPQNVTYVLGLPQHYSFR